MVGYQALGVVTGKPIALGGSVGREEATGRGVMNVLRKFLAVGGQDVGRRRGWPCRGSATSASTPPACWTTAGATVVAISEKNGGHPQRPAAWTSRPPAGTTADTGTLAGLADADEIDNDELLAVRLRRARPGRDGEHARRPESAPHVKARIVVEAANGPTTPDADALLRDMGVTVLPDILANAGGVTVSYFEWVQGLENFFWEKKRVDDELQRTMERAFDAVNATADAADCDYRTGRVHDRHRPRGRELPAQGAVPVIGGIDRRVLGGTC